MIVRITESQLRKIIREEVAKATKDGTFGAYLFGQQRGLPSVKNPEVNTEEEDDFARDLFAHFHADQGELSKWLDTMVALNNQGKYEDILRVPSKYKYAYRTMSNIDHDTLESWLGHDPDDMEPGEIHEENKGGIYSRQDVRHSSWTVDPDMFDIMLEDWGSLTHKSYGYLVFLRAPIKGNTFLLNPDQTEFSADEHAYQKEVISVGPVKFDHIWYVPLEVSNSEDSSNARERMHNIDAKAVKHVADYERARARAGDRNK